MDGIKLKLVKAHERQLMDFDVKRELKSVQAYIDKLTFSLEGENIYFLFVKGIYDDFTKKMTTAMVFINNTGKKICELHGVLRIKPNMGIQIAKVTIDFDEVFMGTVDYREAILVHLNIPVKGIESNKEFFASDMQSEFFDVRVTYVEENDE